MLSQQTAKKVTEGAQKKRHMFHTQNYLAYPQKSDRAIIPAKEVETLTKRQKAIELCAALRNNYHSTTVAPHASWYTHFAITPNGYSAKVKDLDRMGVTTQKKAKYTQIFRQKSKIIC